MRVAGFGFRKSVRLDSLLDVLRQAGGTVDAVATVAGKAPGLAELAQHLGVPLIAVTQGDLGEQIRPGSGRVKGMFGTGSVAESAALVAAGQGARLVVTRVVSADGLAVAAIAEGEGT